MGIELDMLQKIPPCPQSLDSVLAQEGSAPELTEVKKKLKKIFNLN